MEKISVARARLTHSTQVKRSIAQVFIQAQLLVGCWWLLGWGGCVSEVRLAITTVVRFGHQCRTHLKVLCCEGGAKVERPVEVVALEEGRAGNGHLVGVCGPTLHYVSQEAQHHLGRSVWIDGTVADKSR